MYALIIAGGKGERLRPLTDTLPKPMLPLDEKPILWHQIQWLKKAGVTDVVLLTGHLADTIQKYFGDGADCGVNIHYSYEETPLGRGGALRQGFAMLPEDEQSIIATNGDIITDADLATLVSAHATRSKVKTNHCVTVLTVPMKSPYGIVDTDTDGVVSGFREKAILPYTINAGVYVLERDIEHLLPEVGDHETETFPELTTKGRMFSMQHDTFWRSVDSHKDMREAEEFIVRQRVAGT